MFFLLFLFFLLSVLFFLSSHHHQTFNIFDRFWFTAKESTMTRFVVRTWWITLCWSLDIRQPNGSWRIGGAMDGEKMDTCVWQKIKIDAALRIMRHTQKFNSMYINWRKKKKERKTIHPWFSISDHPKSSLSAFSNAIVRNICWNLEISNRWIGISLFLFFPYVHIIKISAIFCTFRKKMERSLHRSDNNLLDLSRKR